MEATLPSGAIVTGAACYWHDALPRPELAFASPRKLPRARELKGRVVVLDVAFASEASSGGFEKITLPVHRRSSARGSPAGSTTTTTGCTSDYRSDPRFVLATKAEHGACPEMVTPERRRPHRPRRHHRLPHRLRRALQRREVAARRRPSPTPAPTTMRAPSTRAPASAGPIGKRFDRALRARPRDTALFGLVVRHLAGGLGRRLALGGNRPRRRGARRHRAASRATIAARYVVVDLRAEAGRAARRRPHARRSSTRPPTTASTTRRSSSSPARSARASRSWSTLDTVSLAARYGSGVSFLELLGLSGGMPTLVSIPKKRLAEACEKLGVTDGDRQRLVGLAPVRRLWRSRGTGCFCRCCHPAFTFSVLQFAAKPSDRFAFVLTSRFVRGSAVSTLQGPAAPRANGGRPR